MVRVKNIWNLILWGKILWIEHSGHSSGVNSYWAIPGISIPYHGRLPYFTLPLALGYPTMPLEFHRH